VLSRR